MNGVLQIALTLGFIALCGWYFWYLLACLKTGELYIPNAKLRRSREPALFKVAMATMLIFTLVASLGALAGLFSLL